MKKGAVLVTGATGFIGKYVVTYLLDEGLKIFAFIPQGEDHAFLSDKAIEIVEGDITFPLQVPAEVSAIYHCAGVIKREEEMERVNVRGTENVVEAAIAYNCRLIHLSSAGVVGSTKEWVIKEETRCNPDNLYEKTKFRAEEIVMRGVGRGLKAQILRPTIVFGTGRAPQDDSFLQLIRAIAAGRYRNISGGSGIYNIIYAGEVARAMSTLDDDAIPNGGTFIINTPVCFSEFASIVLEVAGNSNTKPGNIPYIAALPAAAIFSLHSLLSHRKKALTFSRLKALTEKRSFSQDRLVSTTSYRPLHTVQEYLRKVCEEYGITPHQQPV